MQRNISFNIFSEEENAGYLRLQKFKDRVFQPLCDILKQWRVAPDTLSWLGLIMVAPFIYFFPFNPWISFIFVALNGVLDGLDGALARALGRQSARGAFLDHCLDYLGFFIIFLTLLFYNIVNPFWAAVYLLNYMVMLFFVVFCRNNGIKFFPVVRSKYFFYLVFLVLLLSGSNLFDPFLLLFSVYMMVTNIFLFQRIRCSLL